MRQRLIIALIMAICLLSWAWVARPQPLRDKLDAAGVNLIPTERTVLGEMRFEATGQQLKLLRQVLLADGYQETVEPDSTDTFDYHYEKKTRFLFFWSKSALVETSISNASAVYPNTLGMAIFTPDL